jgi:hypothetical protein
MCEYRVPRHLSAQVPRYTVLARSGQIGALSNLNTLIMFVRGRLAHSALGHLSVQVPGYAVLARSGQITLLSDLNILITI